MTEPAVELGFVRWRATFGKREYADLESLRLIETTFDRLRLNRSKDLVAAARVIADGSKDEDWRLPFGESGILDVAMNIIASPGIDDDLAKQSLRIIGNTCIDTDANRDRVIARNILPFVISQLQTEPWLVIPVLNNIVADYEPAQESARKLCLCAPLISLLLTFQDQQEDIGGLLPGICELLDIATNGEFDVGQCADNEVEVLLTEASDREISVEVFASLVRAVVAHLKDGRHQKLLVTRNLVADVLDLVARSASSSAFHAMSLAETLPERISQEPEDEDQLSAARDALIVSLSDVSATSEFAENYPLNSIMVKTLCNWLSLPEPSSQLCACLMLGNLARSDDVCKGMIHELGLHELLIAILEKSDDLQLLHATLGFLKNLALGDENKGTIAGSGILEPLSKMWSSSSRPQLQYAAIRVVRQLVNGSLSNIQRLLMPLGVAENAAADGDSYIAQLLTLFNQTDDLSIKFEISRIVAAVWRCVRSPASIQYFPDIVELILPRLHCMAAGLAKALEAMVTQSRWPVVRSEGWFALALMARSEGSDAIINLLSDVEFSKAVIEVIGSRGAGTTSPVSAVPGIAISITGADTPEVMPGTEKDIETKDGDNALVLVSELLKNSASHLSHRRRTALEQLLHGSASAPTVQDSLAELQAADHT